MRLKLRQLQYFVAIVDCGSMAAAAQRLNVSATALSLHMREMEDGAGEPLLQRHSRGVRPTASGDRLYRAAMRILDLVEEVERTFTPAEHPARTVRIGMPSILTRIIGMDAALTPPEISNGAVLEIVEGWSRDLAATLPAGGVDLVIGYGLVPDADIRVEDLIEERLVFACAPSAVAGSGPLTLAEILDTHLLVYGRKSVGFAAVQEAAAAAGLAVPTPREVESLHIWRTMLLRGMGTAITPFTAVEEDWRRGDLAVREIAGAPILRRIALAGTPATLTARRHAGIVAHLKRLVTEAHRGKGPYYRFLATGTGAAPPSLARC